MPQWLEKHPVLTLLLLVTVATRVAFEGVYVDFNEDKARQIFIAQWFCGGDGFSFCTADLADLSRITCERNRLWAIGYPLIICAIDFVVGDLVTASIILDAIGVVLLVWALHLLLRHCDVGAGGYALFMVFTALSFTPYYQAGSTDMLCAGFYVLALAWALGSTRGERAGIWRYVAIGLAVFCACFLRYAYYPFVVIVPAFLFLAGLRERSRRHLAGGAIVLISSVVPLLCLLGFYAQYFGSALFLKATTDFFPEHLTHLAPFPLDSLVYTQLIEDNVEAYLPWLAPLLRPGAWLLSGFLLVVFCRHWLALPTRIEEDRPNRPVASFYQLFFATMVLNVAIFVYYSLRNPPPDGWPFLWTYVMERRYYTATMLLVQVAVVVALCRNVTGDRLIHWGARAAMVVAMIFAVSYAAYRAVKVHVLETATIYENRIRRTDRICRGIEKLRAEGHERIVYADGVNVHDSCLVAMGSESRIVLDYRTLVSAPPRATEPTVLLLNIPRERSKREQALLDELTPEIWLNFHRSEVFRFDLPGGRGLESD